MKIASTHKKNQRVCYAEELNAEQLAVVEHPGGPMLVLAGAGTGKTRTLTYRVARLIDDGAAPSEVLLLTFTNKAAREMMRRAETLIGQDMRGLTGGTFHHVANTILKRHAPLLGYGENFLIHDRSDTHDLFSVCITEINRKDKLLPAPKVLADVYSFMKNTMRELKDVLEFKSPANLPMEKELAHVFDVYDDKKLRLNIMDFDDLLLNLRKLLMEHETVREAYASRFRHVLVDEYQDTNALQGAIVDLLSGVHGNLMVVGDDAQSIFSFRGAHFENIMNFTKRHADAAVFKLTTNYRSTPQVLALANSIISLNVKQYEKELRAVLPEGELPRVVKSMDVFEQASFIADAVIEDVNDGGDLSELAVLYRSHYQSLELQMELQKRRVPYEVRSGLKFFEQAHIKDILAYLRLKVNPGDELSWKRILKMLPKVGNVTADKLWRALAQSGDPLDEIFNIHALIPKKSEEHYLGLLKTIDGVKNAPSAAPAINSIVENGYERYVYLTYKNPESRLEDVEQMASYSDRYDSVESFVNDLSLQSSAAEYTEAGQDDEGAALVLSSVHQAKGLEWRKVFIIGLNEGQFPPARVFKADDIEEERRIFYVAVTRARQEVVLLHVMNRDDYHRRTHVRPSSFIRDIPPEFFENESASSKNSSQGERER
jgi:DNA helicase-2/ATP-dependent DNA helicase PcrA